MLLRKGLKHKDLYYILTANNAVVTSQSKGLRPWMNMKFWGFARSLALLSDALRENPGKEVDIVWAKRWCHENFDQHFLWIAMHCKFGSWCSVLFLRRALVNGDFLLTIVMERCQPYRCSKGNREQLWVVRFLFFFGVEGGGVGWTGQGVCTLWAFSLTWAAAL